LQSVFLNLKLVLGILWFEQQKPQEDQIR
jgi:hypothetical protein